MHLRKSPPSKSNKPLVSVIILNWNRKDDLSSLLSNLQSQTYKNFEIIVVDNASTDGSVSFLKEHFSNVEVVQSDKNYALWSFSLGMAAARGDLFVLLSCDSLVKNDLIQKHVQKMLWNPKLGISSACTYDYKTKEYISPNRSIKGNNKKGYEITYFDGNGICVRHEVFKELGGFSKDYFICLEELEWATRVLLKGWQIACFTDVVIYHKKSLKSGEYRSIQGYYYCRNWIWFYLRFLPFSAMPSFLKLHFNSFVKKTGDSGYMYRSDCVRGVFASLKLVPKMLLTRQTVSKKILERIKRDLFPGSSHIYVDRAININA